MYNAPRLERFGTLRELTLAGGTSGTDTFGTNPAAPGCTPTGGSFSCKTS
jgi:hypothetical protein